MRVRAAESADDVCSGFVTCLTPSRCIAAASAASAVRPAHASLRAAGNEGAASSGGLFSKIKNALGGGGKPDKPEKSSLSCGDRVGNWFDWRFWLVCVGFLVATYTELYILELLGDMLLGWLGWAGLGWVSWATCIQYKFDNPI